MVAENGLVEQPASPQASARTCANTRKLALWDEKKPQLRTVGASMLASNE
jgi:hypothetical protein